MQLVLACYFLLHFPVQFCPLPLYHPRSSMAPAYPNCPHWLVVTTIHNAMFRHHSQSCAEHCSKTDAIQSSGGLQFASASQDAFLHTAVMSSCEVSSAVWVHLTQPFEGQLVLPKTHPHPSSLPHVLSKPGGLCSKHDSSACIALVHVEGAWPCMVPVHYARAVALGCGVTSVVGRARQAFQKPKGCPQVGLISENIQSLRAALRSSQNL